MELNCIADLDQLLEFPGMWSDYSVPIKLLGMFVGLISGLRKSESFHNVVFN